MWVLLVHELLEHVSLLVVLFALPPTAMLARLFFRRARRALPVLALASATSDAYVSKSVARSLSSDGKKLPREMKAAMTSEGEDRGGFYAAMAAAAAADARPPRLAALTPQSPTASAEQKALFRRILENRGKTGKAAGFDATNADGSLAGPWNAYCSASPAIGDLLDRMGRACRHDTAAAADLYEVAILVVAARRTSKFEWYAHEKLAVKAGVDRAAIAAIRKLSDPASAPALTEEQRAVYAYAKELDETSRVADATHAAALRAVGSPTALVDLVATIGFYQQVALLLNAFEAPLPPGAPDPFPGTS